MSETERMLCRQRIRAWEQAGPALEGMRHDDIRRSDATGIRAVLPTPDMLQRLGVEISAGTGLVE